MVLRSFVEVRKVKQQNVEIHIVDNSTSPRLALPNTNTRGGHLTFSGAVK
jgi:hypothetical protein